MIPKKVQMEEKSQQQGGRLEMGYSGNIICI